MYVFHCYKRTKNTIEICQIFTPGFFQNSIFKSIFHNFLKGCWSFYFVQKAGTILLKTVQRKSVIETTKQAWQSWRLPKAIRNWYEGSSASYINFNNWWKVKSLMNLSCRLRRLFDQPKSMHDVLLKKPRIQSVHNRKIILVILKTIDIRNFRKM